MRARHRQGVEAPGQDSFLDVVANLVGILIILIVVVGVRAKDALVAAKVEEPQSAEVTDGEVAAAANAARAVEENINQDLAQRLQQQKLETAFRRKERDKLQTLLTAAQYKLDEERNQLDVEQRERFDLGREMREAVSELNELNARIDATENSQAQTVVLKHLPTPMAKTVFGKELHLRLLDGRVAYVPWDELVEKFKAEAPQKIWRLKEAPRYSETIGPIAGFRMRYTLKRFERHMQTNVGSATQRGVELDRFVLIPAGEDLGEPLEAAFREGSELDGILRAREAARTTVTVWTYPNSFEHFRQLKAELYERGFLTAARPLPEGHPIGGSPDGSRSSAQ